MQTNNHPATTQMPQQHHEGAALALPELPKSSVVTAEQMRFMARCCARRPWGRPFVVAGAIGGTLDTIKH